jgi:mono/diheme cytochrome c family protein
MDDSRLFAGTADGPEGAKVPNITPSKAGIGSWSAADIAYFLKTGFTPDFDSAGGAMAEVIRESTSHLTDADRKAIADYLKSVPPMP